MKDKFYLDNMKNSGPVLIMYRRYVNGKPLAMSTGHSIYPELWDSNKQEPTSDAKLIKEYAKQDPTIKIHLSNIKTRITNFKMEAAAYLQTQMSNRKEIDLMAFRDHLKTIVRSSDRNKRIEPKKVNTEDNSFITVYAERFVKEISTGKRKFLKKDKGKKINSAYEAGTVKSYRNCIKAWRNFEDSKRKKFKWDDFNQALYYSLIEYLENNDYGTNYTGKVIKCLKVIFRAAHDEGITASTEFNKKYFVILSVDAHNVALTKEEVKKLECIDLSQNETLSRARDMFLLGCYTALRISDLLKINRDHIKDSPKGKVLDMITTKTKNQVKIPLKPAALNILKKYGFQSPKIAEQTINRSIKQLAKDCGIDDMITFTEVINNVEQENKHPKYKFITNHTGRRTGATLMYKDGIPSLYIMKITGHKTESSFLKYIKIDKDEAAALMAENEYFK